MARQILARQAIGDAIESRWLLPLREALHTNQGNYRIYGAWRGCVQRGEFDHLQHFVDPAKASIDVGANMGQYSLTLSTMSRRCLAIEPLDVYRFLADVLPANCVFRSLAAGESARQTTLRIPVLPNGNVQFGLATLATDNTLAGCAIHKQPTAVLPLDDVVNEALANEPIGFIKVDVEGAELAVLEGARQTLLQHHPALQLEILPPHLSEARRFLDSLHYSGFFFFGGQQFPLDAFHEQIHCAPENAWTPQTHEQFDAERYVSNFYFIHM